MRAYLRRRILLDRLLFTGWLIGNGLAIALAWLLVCALLDRVFAFGPALRAFAFIVEIIFIGLLIVRLAWQVLKPMDFHRAAAAVEPAFNQRLETLVSYWLRSEDSGPSQKVIGELWTDVQHDLPDHRAASAVDWHPLAPTWLRTMGLVIVGALLWMVPAIGLPQLTRRFVLPWNAIPPVTTTQLTVLPGNAKIEEQKPLTVRVTAERLGDTPPTIHFSFDSVNYARALMSAGQGAFIWTLPSAQKDLTYYITGGDARTPDYKVTVLRPPAISMYRVRYDYPSYTHHDPLTVTTQAGLIQAPRDTRVGIDVVSLIPLAQATLQIGKDSIHSTPGDSPDARHFNLLLDHDAVGHLQLSGVDGISAKGAITLNAIPDQPPLAHLLQPAADMHLTPRDLLTIAWQALDDYGVEKLQLQLQVNTEAPRQIPLPISGDRRRCVGIVDLDLANMPLKIGDVLSTSLIAEDGAGHQTHTQVRHILISPRSVDIDTYLRLSALRQAMDLSDALLGNLQDALSVWPNPNRASQTLATAADACSLLRQAILSAIQHRADATTVTALDAIGDQLSIISSAIEQAQNQSVSVGRLIDGVKSIKKIQDELTTIARGEQAAIVLADRANVREMAKPVQSDPKLRLQIEQTLQRAAKEAAAGVAELGISPTAKDIDVQLNERVEQGEKMAASIPAIDLLAAARDWQKQMADPADAKRELAGRLEMAAAVESVRVGGQPIRARDLQLAGLAAHRIEETALHDTIVSKKALAKMIAEYPSALEALLHADTVQTGEKKSAAMLAASASARAQMKLWAAEPDLLTSAADMLTQPAAQDLAMEANARMSQHDYAGAAALDARLANTAEALQARSSIVSAARQMRTAERVDQVSSQQRELAQKTLSSGHSPTLARDQAQVAQRIEQVRQTSETIPALGNSRDQAMAAVLHAQEQMADMPGKLADAHLQSRDVAQQVISAQALAAKLDKFSPEASASVEVIREKLIPSLKNLETAIGKQNPSDIAASARGVRASIAMVQHQLSQMQQKFVEQDPLVAAKWFAEAAASALARTPPDLSAAQQQQGNAAKALQNAWTAAIRKAALQRLAGSATISSPLSEPTAPPTWQPVATPANPPSESEPAGFADALRAYFQTLSQDQGTLKH